MFVAFAIFQIVVFLLATVAWMFLPWLGMLGRTETEVKILMLTPLLGGWAFSAIATILFLPALVSGIAIVKRQEWGRVIGIVTAVLALLEFPLGTAFGVYALRRLRRKNTINNFTVAPLAIVAFVALLFPSTQTPTLATPGAAQRVNAGDITEIRLKDDGGFGYDRETEFALRRDGTATYSGGKHSGGRVGAYQGNFDKRHFAELAQTLIKEGFFSLKHRYEVNQTDSATVTTTVLYDGGQKVVENYAGGGARKLANVERAISSVADKVAWVEINNSGEAKRIEVSFVNP